MMADFVQANLAASVAILLVLLLRKPVRRLFGARIAYALWMVVPIAAMASFLPGPSAQTPISPIVLMAGDTLGRAVPAALGEDHAGGFLVGLWLAGVLGAGGLLARRQERFLASLGGVSATGADPKVLRAERAGVGPAVVGALRPRIVTPADFETRFDPAEREVILAHEGVHLANGDARINALAATVQCLAWFNPLVHLGARVLRMDQELACDAAVLDRFPHARRFYAELLLKTQLASHAPPLGCHWPARAEHPLKERIVVMKFPTPGRTRKAAGLALVTALSLGGACTAWAAQSPAAPGLIAAPDWLLRPTGEDVARYYPAQAKAQGVTGSATIGCRVDQDGRLENCAVLKEGQNGEAATPYGFGQAALQLSKHFQMKGVSRDGAPTSGGQVRIPILFVLPDGSRR